MYQPLPGSGNPFFRVCVSASMTRSLSPSVQQCIGGLSEDTTAVLGKKKRREIRAQRKQRVWCTCNQSQLSPHSAHVIQGPCMMVGARANRTLIPCLPSQGMSPKDALPSGAEDGPLSNQFRISPNVTGLPEQTTARPLCTDAERPQQRHSGAWKGPQVALPLKQVHKASRFPFCLQPSPA